MYVSQSSPRVLISVVAIAVVVRLALGQWSWADAIVAGLTVVAIGPVEWLLHRHLLHADERSWTTRRLGTGTGHRRHHLDPPDVEWLLLHRMDAWVFSAMIAVLSAAWAVPTMWLLGRVVGGVPVLAPTVTAILLAWAALAHYEWAHLLEHGRYRPKTRYYQRLVSNHRLHHFRNEGYWLGITSSLGDRVMGTNPERSDVPLSPTARSLS